MAVVYRYIEILTSSVFFRSPGVFHSQDSFPSAFYPQLWKTSSGVVAVGLFTAEALRELWAHPSRLHLIYLVHVYCHSVIGQHSDNWNLIGQFLYRCSLWSEVQLHHCHLLEHQEIQGKSDQQLWRPPADPARVPGQKCRAVDGSRQRRRPRLDIDHGWLNCNWHYRDCDSQLNLMSPF